MLLNNQLLYNYSALDNNMRNKIEILTINCSKGGVSSGFLNFPRSFYGHNKNSTCVITCRKLITLVVDVLSYDIK